jgi:hypothetical protein
VLFSSTRLGLRASVIWYLLGSINAIFPHSHFLVEGADCCHEEHYLRSRHCLQGEPRMSTILHLICKQFLTSYRKLPIYMQTILHLIHEQFFTSYANSFSCLKQNNSSLHARTDVILYMNSCSPPTKISARVRLITHIWP